MKILKKTMWLAICSTVLLAGCEARISTADKGSKQDKASRYEEFATDSGIECVALGLHGMSGRGLSCNWDKYNSGS